MKDQFAKHLSPDIVLFAERLSDCFRTYLQLDAIAPGNEQATYVTGFVHGILDDLLVSVKLLVTGKLTAAGNLMRQALEGVAVATLCSARCTITLRTRKRTIQVNYFQLLKARSPELEASKAVDHLDLNCATLGIKAQFVEQLRAARRVYHPFSHPTMLSIACRVGLGDMSTIYVGGHFDESKIDVYKTEIKRRYL